MPVARSRNRDAIIIQLYEKKCIANVIEYRYSLPKRLGVRASALMCGYCVCVCARARAHSVGRSGGWVCVCPRDQREAKSKWET
jgi:hypothetical protein